MSEYSKLNISARKQDFWLLQAASAGLIDTSVPYKLVYDENVPTSMVSMSIGNVAPNSHRPEAELSLPPQVTGLIKGESLLHISGLKLADGRHEGQTLQVTSHLNCIPHACATEASWQPPKHRHSCDSLSPRQCNRASLSKRI